MKPFRRHTEDFLEKLKLLAPGTVLYQGIENVLRAKTGALIVIGYNDQVARLVTGGFAINTDFSASALYELAKMDGAVILSNDAKRILYANAELSPDPGIHTSETGIRHRSAERTARQTGLAVVAVSQRRDVITLFRGPHKYVFQEENKLLAKANQALQTLEKYRRYLDDALKTLNALEVEDKVTLGDVCLVVKLMEIVYRIADEIEVYTIQLGNEGRLVRMQLEELSASLDQEYRNVVLDYENMEERFTLPLFGELMESLSDEALLDHSRIAGVLGYRDEEEVLDAPLVPRGYRQLAHIPRLPQSIIAKVIHHHSDFQGMLKADSLDLEEVDGVGEVRARAIYEGLRRKREAVRGGTAINI